MTNCSLNVLEQYAAKKVAYYQSIVADHPIGFGDTLYVTSIKGGPPQAVQYIQGKKPGEYQLKPVKPSLYGPKIGQAARPVRSTHDLIQSLSETHHDDIDAICVSAKEARVVRDRIFDDTTRSYMNQ